MAKTKIYKNYQKFSERPKEEEEYNGVSPSYSIRYPDYEVDNDTNTGCWNCFDCSEGKDLIGERRINVREDRIRMINSIFPDISLLDRVIAERQNGKISGSIGCEELEAIARISDYKVTQILRILRMEDKYPD